MHWFCQLLTHIEDGLCFLNARWLSKVVYKWCNAWLYAHAHPYLLACNIQQCHKCATHPTVLRSTWGGYGIPMGWLIQSHGTSNNRWGFEAIIFVHAAIYNKVVSDSDQFHWHCLAYYVLIRLRHVQWARHPYRSICVTWLPLLGVWTNKFVSISQRCEQLSVDNQSPFQVQLCSWA